MRGEEGGYRQALSELSLEWRPLQTTYYFPFLGLAFMIRQPGAVGRNPVAGGAVGVLEDPLVPLLLRRRHHEQRIEGAKPPVRGPLQGVLPADLEETS